MKKEKKQYRLVSVRMEVNQYEKLRELRKAIGDVTQLPVSLHWLLNEAIVCGGEHLKSRYI